MSRILKPLELPDDAPEAARQRAAEYALGLIDVAAMFGVSKQTAFDWARLGRLSPGGVRTILPSLRAPAVHRQEPLRFRVADLLAFAEEQGLTCDPTLLPLELQRRLAVGAYDPSHTPFNRAVVSDEQITESTAARQLGVSRSHLQKLRVAGRLNPALHIDGTSYSQLDVFRVLDGELELRLEVPR